MIQMIQIRMAMIFGVAIVEKQYMIYIMYYVLCML